MTLPPFAEHMVPMGCKEGDMVEGSFGLCEVYRHTDGHLRLKRFEEERTVETMSMAEFETGGMDALKYILDRYKAVFYWMPGGGVDVGAFSLERHDTMEGSAKYGLLEALPGTSVLITSKGDGHRTPVETIEMPWATDDQKAAYIACGLLQRMILAEVARAKP